MRCAAIHRKLGTHISKVKSLSMDSWNNDQVEVSYSIAATKPITYPQQNMKLTGNIASNLLFNPRNRKPAIPMDIDEVDGVMERFIRQKYEQKALSGASQPGSRQHTGSTSSDDHRRRSDDRQEPTLPPKPNKRFTFGLRSASSALPLSRHDRSPPLSPGLDGFGRRPSPPRRNKPSKIFGADIGGSRQDNYELKLITLRQMGFSDDRRNLTILKGENGNVDRAAATLLRIGEGSRMSSGRSSPAPEPPIKDELLGITIEKARTPQTLKTMNPFDRLDLQEKALPPPPVEEQSPQKPPDTYPSAYNPFVQQTQPTGLEQSFQGLQVQQPSQLFPNTTGGYSSTQLQPQTNPFLQTYTPPPTVLMQNHYPSYPGPGFAPQQQFTQPQQSAVGVNPFLRTSQSQIFQSSNPFSGQLSYPMPSNSSGFTYGNAQHNGGVIYDHGQQNGNVGYGSNQQNGNALGYGNNDQQAYIASTLPPTMAPSHVPSAQNPFHMANQFQPQLPVLQTQYTRSPATQSPATQSPVGYNPFHPPQQQQYEAPIQPQPQSYPHPPRYDKNSILALYNTPAPALSRSGDDSSAGHVAPSAKRSVTMPLPSIAQPGNTPQFTSSTLSPFAPNTGGFAPAPVPLGVRHVSNESVDFAGAGMFNGRHSPDAFAGLSARINR
jgi:hypothetical protein